MNTCLHIIIVVSVHQMSVVLHAHMHPARVIIDFLLLMGPTHHPQLIIILWALPFPILGSCHINLSLQYHYPRPCHFVIIGLSDHLRQNTIHTHSSLLQFLLT